MNRGLKNVIMIALCVLLAGAMVFTWFLSSKRTGFDPQQAMGQNFGGQMGERPEGFGDGEMPQGGQMGERPEMPEGEMPQMPEGGENPQAWNMPNQPFDPGEMPEGERPEMPQGGQMGERPEMPEGGFSGQMPEGFDGEMPEGFDGQMPGGFGRGRGVSVVYYVIFGAEALVFSLLLLYLLFSGFNGRTFRETFASPVRVILYILFVLLLSAGLSFGFFLLTRRSRMARPGGFGGMGGMGSPEYNSANEIESSGDYAETAYTSTAADENALSVSGVSSVSLTNVEISKTGDSDGGDSTSFYGINSAVIAKDGAVLTIEGGTITTDAVGANGVFSYGGTATTNNTSGDGTTVNISGSSITTSKDNSGGIMTTGGGVMNAKNLTITTAGTSSAAIRTDRGGGTVNVDGGTYRTTGQGSPAIYSTADVTVRNSELVAEASEGAIIEGKNSISLENCTLTDTNCVLNGQSTTYKNIFLYQSMSGDAAEGTAEFTARDCTITTNQGDALYVTNTNAVIRLQSCDFVSNDPEGYFLRAQADSWGQSGSNGGIVTLAMTDQTAQGRIVADKLSTLDIVMEASEFEGEINAENTAKALTLTLDAASHLKLTGDCYLTDFSNAQADNSNIDFNGFTIYVNGNPLN